jgi:hypothetical protein
MSRYSLIVVALVAAHQAAIAQPDGARVRAGVDTFHISRVEHGRPVAPDTLVQALLSVRWNGQPALLQVYRQRDFSGGAIVDSLWMHPRTLEPLRHARRSSYLAADLRFTKGRITGTIRWPDGRRHMVDTIVAGPIYDAGATELIARALPLTPGETAHLTLYVPGYGVNPMKVALAGEDTVRSHRGVARSAWRLTGSIGGEPVTMWVATDNRDLLQLVAGEPTAPTKYVRH